MPIEQRRMMMERNSCKLSIRKQCELLNVTRSVLYYVSRRDDSADLAVMRLLDEQ